MSDRLMFSSRYHKSKGPKSFILFMLTLAICIAIWFIFFNPTTPAKNGNLLRQIILIMCGVIYLARLVFTMFVFLKRRLSWLEALPISVLMSLVLFWFIYIGGIKSTPLNIVDLAGMILYLIGSFINTASELNRYRWKSLQKNQGHLYTGGLFKRVRHVNYFGDIVLFFGFALITQDIRALYVPLFMALNFVFILIPAKETHLKEKYGEEFEQYSQGSKKLIPMIF
jgi:protein-S-isoprenylcysteine O-methyltransferase Ste14